MEDLTHSVIVIPFRDGRIPLAQRQPGTRMAGLYVTPGGSINPPGGEETPVDVTIPGAARRETREEMGVDAEEERFIYLGKHTDRGEDWQPIGGHFFLLPMREGEEPVTSAKEKEKQGPWRWYTYREAAALPLPAISRGFIHALAHAGGGG